MAEENVQLESQDASTDTTDWKAEARKWESRAKKSKAAQDELEKLKQAQMTEQQKAQAKIAKLQKELDARDAAAQQATWRSQVAKDSKLPLDLVNVLHGSTLEELQAAAKVANEFVHPAPQLPVAPHGDKQPESQSNDMSAFVGQLFDQA